MPKNAIRSNSMPQGGVTAQQPIPPNVSPASIDQLVQELTPTISKFRAQSSPLEIPLNRMDLVPGQEASIRITSVGLGYRIVSEHTVTISLTNNGAASETISFGDYFPYNILANTNISINGGATVYSCSGIAGILTALRDRKATIDRTNRTFPSALVRISVTNGTLQSGIGFTGYSGLSIAAGQTATLIVTFYTFEKLALSRDSLLGVLPLQNNSVFAALTRRMTGNIIGANPSFPLYNAGADIVLNSAQMVSESTYKFWSVPNDPGLYADMVTNSYQIQEQPQNVVNSVGANALVFQLPQNQFLIALHLLLRDANGNSLNVYQDIPRFQIQYNGGAIIPVRQFGGRQRAEEFLDYAGDMNNIPGYRLWDGTNTSDSLTQSDDAGWIDTYAAATPEIVADINGAVAVPVTYSVVREAIVAGSVAAIGG